MSEQKPQFKYLLQAEYDSMLRKARSAANPGPDDRDWNHLTKIERQAYKAVLELERILRSHQQCVDALKEEAGRQNCICRFLGYLGKEPPCGKCKLDALVAEAEKLGVK